MELVALPACLGVEIRGVDLTAGRGGFAGLGPGGIDRLRAALDERHLLLCRAQQLSGEQQVAFVGRFGPLVTDRNLWTYVSNVRDDGIVREGALLFHSDFAFAREPLFAISLHAVAVPADGAPTRFADAARAARLLPAGLRRRLDGRRVLNLYDFHAPNDRPMRERGASPGSPRFEHPVVGHSPRTGEEVVFANQMHTDRIVGLPAAESRALLEDLFAVVYDPSNIYEHRWEVGDVVLWDNIALHHGRPDFPLAQARTLQRVALGRYTSSELVADLDKLLTPAIAGAAASTPGSAQAPAGSGIR